MSATAELQASPLGPVPSDWRVVRVDEAGQVLGGRQRSPGAVGEPTKYLRVANVFDGYIDTSDVLEMPFTAAERERFALRDGDILLNEGQSLELVGRSAIFRGEVSGCVYQNTLIRFRANKGVVPEFVQAVFHRYVQSGVFAGIALQTTSIAHLGVSRLASLALPLPGEIEQRAIATALRDVDDQLAILEQLIAKKRDLKQAAMQQLLTGRVRLCGFRGNWNPTQIGRICHPSSSRNTHGRDLPVLSCSKHLGFVESLRYFKNQVFSDDRRGYKIIRRDEIGYPANHIEEGSIGLQELFDEALVSPIYVVFRVAPEVSSYFLHRLLKLDVYRERFHAATSSSVDRRGSLRWRQFAEITVSLPDLKEQLAVAEVLRTLEAELAVLEARRDKTRQLKQGMMQALLTGRIRLT